MQPLEVSFVEANVRVLDKAGIQEISVDGTWDRCWDVNVDDFYWRTRDGSLVGLGVAVVKLGITEALHWQKRCIGKDDALINVGASREAKLGLGSAAREAVVDIAL